MPKRPTIWIDNLVNLTVATGAQGSISLLTGRPPINMNGTTITRTIFDLQLYSTTIAGAHGIQIADLGFGVTSQEAFNAGVFPDPEADERPLRGWLYRTRCTAFQNGVETNPLAFCKGDLRNQRKIDDGEYFMVVTNQAILGTAFSVQMTGIIRVLLKLP